MTDSNDATEKEHLPTGKRLAKLKKEGTFLRAKEFSSGVSLMMGIMLLVMMSHYFVDVFTRNFVRVFTWFGNATHDDRDVYILYKQLAIDNILLVLSVGGVLCAVVVASTFLLGGFGFSMSLLKFKAERLSPGKNLKRMVSPNNAVEVLKSIFKLILFLGMFLFFLYKHNEELFNLSATDRVDGVKESVQFIQSFLMVMMVPIGLLALIDMLYNYYAFHKKIKMSLQEIKDENKDAESSPEVKRKMRVMQREMLRRSVQLAVPQATVIITNPTHYAIALRYNENKDKAPKIIAKGMDHMATEIRLLAIKNAIPIYESPQLARAIYFTGKVGTYIHQDLYMAVAIVLSYVVQLKNYQRGLAKKPDKAADLQIPKAFHFE